MGSIRKKKPDALTRMSGFLSIEKSPTLYTEDFAKQKAAELQSGDPSWKWEAVLRNTERNLWAIMFTDEDGYTEQFNLL